MPRVTPNTEKNARYSAVQERLGFVQLSVWVPARALGTLANAVHKASIEHLRGLLDDPRSIAHMASRNLPRVQTLELTFPQFVNAHPDAMEVDTPLHPWAQQAYAAYCNLLLQYRQAYTDAWNAGLAKDMDRADVDRKTAEAYILGQELRGLRRVVTDTLQAADAV